MTETSSTLTSESKPSFFDNIKGNPLYWFLTKAVAFYLIWSLVPLFGLDTHSKFNDWLTWNIADQSAMALHGIGFNAEASSHLYSNPDPIANPTGGPVMYNLIRIDGKALVHIEAGCNALVLMAFFSIFILAYPGPSKKKLWFIPLGIFIIHLINLGRVSLLSYNKYTHDANFDFNHKYLFSIVVYLAIFGLWMLWANKISGVKNII